MPVFSGFSVFQQKDITLNHNARAMSDGVIFGTKAEASLWNEIERANNNSNPVKRANGLANILTKILSSEEPVNSQILCRMINIIAAEEAEGWMEDVKDLVSKRRARDCRPVLTAASCLTHKGHLTDAQAYLDEMGEAPDKAMYHYIMAEIAFARGELRESKNELVLALCSDRLYHDVYEMLMKVEPNVNWAAMEACERMSRGLRYEEPPVDNTPETEIFNIYREWYEGSHDSATRMLINSSGYIDKVAPYCILSARMSRDEGDWHSCQMMLEEANRALENDVALQCEIGNAYLQGGSPDVALARFRDAEAFDLANPAVVRGMVDAELALKKNNDALHIIKEFLDSEMATYRDYVNYSKALLNMGFYDDAADAATKILYNHSGDVAACVILSRVALNDGNFREAELYAKTGVSKNKKDAEALAQLARVYLALRRPGKASSIAKRAVSADRKSLLALTTLMEIYRETGDNDRAMDVCRTILEMDPGNNEAADILSKLELARAVRDSSPDDEELPQVIGAEDFIRLISTLISEGKYTEVEKLCKDNDHRFGSVAEVRRLRGNAEYALGEYLKASASFASAAVLMKGDAELWHSKGLADEKFGDLDSAEEAFGKAVLLDMYNPKYWVSNGCIKEKKGDLDGAIKAFNRAIELDPASSYALVRKAAIFASSGMFSEALNFLELAEATDSKNPLILTVKMKVCLKASRFTDAVFIGRKLMKKDPDSSTVAIYARANMGLQDTVTAKKVLDKALVSDPESLDLLTAYRDLCVMTADNASIIDTCNQILKIDPIDRATKKALADALIREGRSDEANLLYSSIKNEPAQGEEVKQETEDPVAMFNIAKSMFAAGDLASAARLTDRAMASDPDNIDYALFRAVIYRKSGDKRVADMFLSQYLERNPTNGSVNEAIGDMRYEDGDLKGAAAAYGKAIQGGINKPSLYVKLGNVQEAMGAYTPATNSYTTAVMLDPHDAEAGRYLANMQLRAKDYESAMRTIRASINSEPTGESYAILAMICQGMKDRAGVRDAYQGFLRFEDVSEESVQNVVSALNSVGLRTEATMLKGHPGMGGDEEEADTEVAPEVKRCAERIMRRAYVMGAEVTDPGISEGVVSDPAIAKQALDYLADIPIYGDVIYGTNECAHLDELSYNIVDKKKTIDLESLTIETAYLAGRAKDADEAKLLLAYIRSARVSRLPRVIPVEFTRMGAETDPNKSLEEVMLDNKVGIFAARMILGYKDNRRDGTEPEPEEEPGTEDQ